MQVKAHAVDRYAVSFQRNWQLIRVPLHLHPSRLMADRFVLNERARVRFPVGVFLQE